MEKNYALTIYLVLNKIISCVCLLMVIVDGGLPFGFYSAWSMLVLNFLKTFLGHEINIVGIGS